MTYKLAKQLKDAGFPQRTFDVETHYAGKCFEDRCYIPTLSELIDACGLEIWSLERIVINLKQKWYANYECSGVPKTNGKTPEEAVAKLWIKLNKK